MRYSILRKLCTNTDMDLITWVEMIIGYGLVHSASTIGGGRVTVSRDNNSDTMRYNHAG